MQDGDAIEYGWVTEWHEHSAWRVGMNYNCLVWHHGKQAIRFLVDRQDGIDCVELRSLPHPDDGIWIVRVVGTSREVVGALDRRSGQFVNFRGMRLDDRASLHQQERTVYSSTDPDKPLPTWATCRGGILLAQMPDSE
jgi:hypothetical protein